MTLRARLAFSSVPAIAITLALFFAMQQAIRLEPVSKAAKTPKLGQIIPHKQARLVTEFLPVNQDAEDTLCNAVRMRDQVRRQYLAAVRYWKIYNNRLGASVFIDWVLQQDLNCVEGKTLRNLSTDIRG